jgi:hypothetical protein
MEVSRNAELTMAAMPVSQGLARGTAVMQQRKNTCRKWKQSGERKTFTSARLSFLINAEPKGTAMNMSPVRVAAAEPHK